MDEKLKEEIKAFVVKYLAEVGGSNRPDLIGLEMQHLYLFTRTSEEECWQCTIGKLPYWCTGNTPQAAFESLMEAYEEERKGRRGCVVIPTG